MPESSLWSLVIMLVATALAFALKNADLRRTIKNLQKELDAARSEIKTNQDKFDESISDIQKLHVTQIKELSDTTSDLQSKLTKTRTSSAQHNNLDGEKIKILIFLSQQLQSIDSSQIAHYLSMSLPTTKFHLEELHHMHLVHRTRGLTGFDRGNMMWSIEHDGNRYLLEHKLIS